MKNISTSFLMAFIVSSAVCLAQGTGFTRPSPPEQGKGANEPGDARADARITRAVERRLEGAPGVHSLAVQVNTQHGIVTLSGQASNLLTRTRAAELAGAIRGVRDVRNRIEVAPSHRSPWDIRSDVEDALWAAPALQNDSIRTQVHDGNVRLSGTVGSWAEKHQAELLTQGVWGVRGVNNQLNVAYGVRRSDSQIKADILSRIRWDTQLRSPELQVAVQDGNVRFDGFVESASGRNRVYQDGWVTGVRSVDTRGIEVVSDIRQAMRHAGPTYPTSVTATGRVTDAELQSAITKLAAYDPLLLPSRMNVRVLNGQVTLDGTVSTLEAKQRAEDLARNVPGVESVNDLLRVRPRMDYSDAQIQRRIQAALAGDSVLYLHPLRVDVNQGRVFLSGQLATSRERQRASLVAAQMPGVIAVENQIRVPLENLPPAGVSQPSLATDQHIQSLIEEQLKLDPLVDAGQIGVNVENGVATLSGSVDTRAERQAAIQCAREGGAAEVVDSLNMRDTRSG